VGIDPKYAKIFIFIQLPVDYALKGRKKDFWEGYGSFFRIIRPLAEAI
jgi:hypothetical protein